MKHRNDEYVCVCAVVCVSAESELVFQPRFLPSLLIEKSFHAHRRVVS